MMTPKRLLCLLDIHDLRTVFMPARDSKGGSEVLECRRCGTYRYRIPHRGTRQVVKRPR